MYKIYFLQVSVYVCKMYALIRDRGGWKGIFRRESKDFEIQHL